MIKLTEMEINEIVACIRQGNPLPYGFKNILFESNDGNNSVICEERNKQIRQTDFDKISLGKLIGVSPKIKKIFYIIQKIADKDVPVLIQGEMGTGKRIVAQTIHEISSRGEGPFVVIDCGSLSEHDFDGKFFGAGKGYIELAQGGTIFFNKIGELALPLQARLTPFFREKAIQNRNNGTSTPINTRIIASTDIDLKQAMEDGNFRSEIFFHINTTSISVPALRERDEDILLLANAFLERYSRENKNKLSGFTNDAFNALISYSWPGNVLELKNFIRNAVVMAKGNKITREDLGIAAPISENSPEYRPLNLKEAKESLEKEMIVKSLIQHQNNLTQAADALGISRPTLYDLIKRYDLKFVNSPAAEAAGWNKE
jgi:two-component system, NtrC family, response regulator